MSTDLKKPKGGSKLARSEITTVRLDPKLKYLAELAARKQRRTLSSFIEWAIEDTLGRIELADGFEGVTFLSQGPHLWDVDEADRFAKLALHFPELLTHDEQVLWKLVKECGYLWKGSFKPTWTWVVAEQTLILDRLRANWETFRAVARGDEPPTSLPKWPRTRPAASASESKLQDLLDDMDDDIPF